MFLFGSPNLSLSEIHRLWQLVHEKRPVSWRTP
jgi:hypothetical protein